MNLVTTKAVSPAALANNGPKATWTTQELDGYAIHGLQFVLGGTFTKAMISAIQVKIAGKIVVDGISGTDLDEINFWDANIQDAAGYLWWHFGEPSAADFYGKHVGDLDLSTVRDKSGQAASLEISWTYTGATNPTLAVEADLELAKHLNKRFQGGEGVQVKTLRHTQLNPGGALNQSQQVVDIAQYAGAGILSQYWFHANMTKLQVYKDSALVWDNLSIADMNAVAARYNHPAVSGLYTWSPTLQHAVGQLINSLKGVHTPSGATNSNPSAPANYRFLLSTSAADTIDVFTKVIAPFAAI